MKSRYLGLAAGLWLLAAVQHQWVAPQLERLPAYYFEETSYAATSRYRETPSGEWHDSNLTFRRVDQTLTHSPSHSIVQGDLHATDASGVVLYESTGIYGVDRRTRENLAGYGDVARDGAFLFPPRLARTEYRYWDQMYGGPRTAAFKRVDQVEGLTTYVFEFNATGIDETPGYSHLADVPERYLAHTDGKGTIWIEPRSGVVVDYEEQGTSFFVDSTTKQRVAALYQWQSRYTPETKAAKLQQAAETRLRSTMLSVWLPLAAVLAGALCLALAWRGRRKLGDDQRSAADQSQGAQP